MNRIAVLSVVLALCGGVSGLVFDEAVWHMKPQDLNGNGLADKGELVDQLQAANLSADVHKAIPYGFDANRKIVSTAGCATRFLANQTFTSFRLGNDPENGKYFHGDADLGSAIRAAGYTGTSEGLTAVFRVRPDDVTANTRWIARFGDHGGNGDGWEVGFQSSMVRLYHNAYSALSTNTVKPDVWIDVAVTRRAHVSVDVNGVSVVTGLTHIVYTYPGAGISDRPYYVYDVYSPTKVTQPASPWILGSENLEYASRSSAYSNSKFFLGDIQQVAVWDRALSDEEILETFMVPEQIVRADPATTSYEVPAGTSLVFDVPEGATLTYSGSITGAGEVRKFGKGTLVLANAANSYAGGTFVAAGDLAMPAGNKGTPFGSGPVTVSQVTGGRLVVDGTLANALSFLGASSRARTGLHIAGVSTVSGAVTAEGDLYLSTAWADDPFAGTAVRATFSGSVTLASGARLAGAPHCTVRFSGPVTADLVEGYYVDNSEHVSETVCPTRGNLGAFSFSSAANAVKKVLIDQTRVVCAVKNCLTDFEVEFTGEHRADGWGCLDMAGWSLDKVVRVTAPVATDTDEGCQILNSNTTSSTVPTLTVTDTLKDGLFAVKLDGRMNLTLQGGANKPTCFTARHHTMAGTFTAARGRITFLPGCTFAQVTKISANNAASVDFTGLEAGAFSGVRTLGSSSSFSFTIRPDIFTPRAVDLVLTGWNSGGACPSDSLTIKGEDEVFEVKSMNYKKADENVNLVAGQGDYGEDDVYSLHGACIVRVFTPIPDIPITWTGAGVASGAAFGDKSNWKDAEGAALAADPDFTLPKHAVTFDGAEVEIPGNVHVGNLVLRNGATVTGAPGSALDIWGTVTVADAVEAETDYVFDVPLVFESSVQLVLPRQATFTAAAGLAGPGSVILDGQARDAVGTGYNVTPVGGVFTIAGESPISGDVVVTNAIANFAGTLGQPGGTGRLVVQSSLRPSGATEYDFANVVFTNIVCNKNVEINSVGGIAANTNFYSAVQFAAETENVFNGVFHWYSSHILAFRKDAKVVFNGGYRGENSLTFVDVDSASRQTEIVFNSPLVGTNPSKSYLQFSGPGRNTRLVFNAPGSSLAMHVLLNGYSRVLESNVDNPVQIATYLNLNDAQLRVKGGTSFTSPRLLLNAGSIVETVGTDPATLVVASEDATNMSTIQGTVRGKLDLALKSVASHVLKVQTSVAATGTLAVESGTLEFAAGAGWQNMSAASVTGGTLKLADKTQLAPGAVALVLVQSGRFEVAQGQLSVASLTLDGQPQRNGVYTAANTSGLVAVGSVRVGPSGLTLIFR